MSKEAEGIHVVLSVAQLSAILVQESLSESATITNRLWGGARVVGGVLELAGAAVLCAAPEPTMASKVGCVVFGIHGADSASAGFSQLWTGRDTQGLVHSGTATLARSLGAGFTTAECIGLAVDIAVPVALSAWLGAVRVAAVRAGEISLIEHEAVAGSRGGGHTLAKHVGRSEEQLRVRLLAEPNIPAASTFTSLRAAERAVSQVLRMNASNIKTWAQNGARHRLILTEDLGFYSGSGVVRETGRLMNMSKVRVVLKLEGYNGQPYYVLTAFVVPSVAP